MKTWITKERKFNLTKKESTVGYLGDEKKTKALLILGKKSKVNIFQMHFWLLDFT
jgi:hypothetical protein